MHTDDYIEGQVLTVLNQFNAAFAMQDMDTIRSLFVPDPNVVFIGIASHERSKGINEIEKQIQRDWIRTEGLSLVMKWHSISTTNHIAWAAAEYIAHVKSDEEDLSFPLRLTAVLEKIDEKWLITQWHTSMPVSWQWEEH